MSRVPVVSGDTDGWGALLNDFLAQHANADGSLKSAAVRTALGGSIAVNVATAYGTTDVAAQAAADAANAAGGGRLLFTDATFAFAASVRIYPNTTVEISPTATIDISAAGAIAAFTVYGVLSDGTTKATAGNLGPGKVGAKLLTADSVVNGTSLTVAAGDEAGFAANTYALVGSGKVYEIQTGIYGSSTVNGNQTVAPGGNLAVASSASFAASGMIYSGGQQYVYTAKPDGTHLTLRDGGTFVGANYVGTGARIGELVKVSGTLSTEIDIYGRLQSGFQDAGGAAQLIYQTTDLPAAFVQPITLVSNVNFIGTGTIKGSLTTPGQQGIRMEFALDCHVGEGLNFQHLTSAVVGLSCIDCTNDLVSGTDFWNTGSGYMCEWGDACQNCISTRVQADRGRHVFTSGTASIGGYGQCRHVGIADSTAPDSVNSGAAFDTHGNAEDAFFDDVHVQGSSEEGIRIRCGWATVRNSSGQGTQNQGILATNYTLGPTRFDLGEGSSFDACGTAGFPGLQVQWTGLAGHYPPVWAIKIRGQYFNPGNVLVNVHGDATHPLPAVDLDVEGVSPGSASYALFLQYLDQPRIGGYLRELASTVNGAHLDHVNNPDLTGLTVVYSAAGSGAAINGLSVVGGLIGGNSCPNGGKGLVLDNASSGVTIGVNDFGGCTTPYSLGTGQHTQIAAGKVTGNLTGNFLAINRRRAIAAELGCGYKMWNFEPGLAGGGTAPTAGTIYLMSTAWLDGDPITNLIFNTTVAGSGTVPTSITAALLDTTGKILAVTAELKSDAGWTASGPHVYALTGGPYLPTSDAAGLIAFLQIGSWSVTQHTMLRGGHTTGLTAASKQLSGFTPADTLGGTAQTNSLVTQGVGATLVIANGDTNAFSYHAGWN